MIAKELSSLEESVYCVGTVLSKSVGYKYVFSRNLVFDFWPYFTNNHEVKDFLVKSNVIGKREIVLNTYTKTVVAFETKQLKDRFLVRLKKTLNKRLRHELT